MGNTVITIAREYGSGGRIIGKKLAEELGISFYDSEMIMLVAKKSGYTEDFVRKAAEQVSMSFLYSLYMTSQELPASDQVFIATSNVIKELAEKESCVIVGRCADYVLKDNPDALKVFIHAPLEKRIDRVKNEYKEQAKDYAAYIQKKDKNRASYYSYFAYGKWGRIQNYDLCVNSAIGIEQSVDVIKNYLSHFKGGNN